MIPFIYIDTEYSGFFSADTGKSGELLQLAAVPVINGIPGEPFNQYCKPLSGRWSLDAQKVHKIKRDFAVMQQSPESMANNFMEFIRKHDQIFTLAGWNCAGDNKYVDRLMLSHGHINDWKKHVRWEWRDVKNRAQERKSHLPVKDFKLGTVAKFFGLEHDAHDALSDAMITWKIDERLGTIKVKKDGVPVVAVNGMTNAEKKAKYTDSRYLMVNGEGSVFINEEGTKDPEIMKIILEELYDIFVEGR